MVDISKFVERAEDAFKKRNYQYAVQMYLEALQVDPGNVDARKALRVVLLQAHSDGAKIQAPAGKTLVLTRDPKVQLTESEKSVVKDPRSAKYNMRVGDALAALGFHEAAGHVYQYVVDYCEKGKENVEAMKAGARAFIDGQRVDLAQKLLARARQLAPQDKDLADLLRNTAAASHMSRISAAGTSRDMLKDAGEAGELELLNKKVLSKPELDRALDAVARRLAVEPADKGMIKKKAELLGKAKQFDAAYKWLISQHEALGGAQDLAELAVRYKKMDFDYKLRYCEHKARENPAEAADWQEKAKQVAAAQSAFEIQEYNRQVEETPADLDKRFALGQALFDAGHYQQAVAHLQRASKSPKVGKQVGILLGRCLAQMNRPELAVQQLQNVRVTLSDAEEDLFNEVRYWLADAYDRLGDSDRAVSTFQELFLDNAAFRDVGKRLDRLQNRA